MDLPDHRSLYPQFFVLQLQLGHVFDNYNDALNASGRMQRDKTEIQEQAFLLQFLFFGRACVQNVVDAVPVNFFAAGSPANQVPDAQYPVNMPGRIVGCKNQPVPGIYQHQPVDTGQAAVAAVRGIVCFTAVQEVHGGVPEYHVGFPVFKSGGGEAAVVPVADGIDLQPGELARRNFPEPFGDGIFCQRLGHQRFICSPGHLFRFRVFRAGEGFCLVEDA